MNSKIITRILTFGFLIFGISDCHNYKINSLEHEFFFESDFASIYDIGGNAESKPSKYSNQKCIEDIQKIRENILNSHRPSMQMIDSWGHIPMDISSDFKDLGRFDTCLGFNVMVSNISTVSGQYCLLEYTKDGFGGRNSIGICIPKLCSQELIERSLDRQDEIRQEVSIHSCQTKDDTMPLRTIDVIAIVVFLAIVCFAIFCAIYDSICSKRNKIANPLLMAFSVQNNWKKLFYCDNKRSNDDFIHCMDGIRVIATVLVVLYHSNREPRIIAPNSVANWVLSLHFTTKHIITHTMDTFFVMSGLLLSINTLAHLEKTKGRLNLLVFYLGRIFRLTPLLAACLFFQMTLLQYFGEAPLWPDKMQEMRMECKKSWWTVLLFINNFNASPASCFGHTWYLSVDSQLFLVSPLIIYPIHRQRIKMVFALLLVIGGVTYYNIEVDPADKWGHYFQTQVRSTAWLIGIIGGYVVHENRKEQNYAPKIFYVFAWILSISSCIAVIVGQSYWETEHIALMDSLYRIIWSTAILYMIYACIRNRGGLVNSFLSNSLWKPFAKIGFAVYLIHFMAVHSIPYQMRTIPYIGGIYLFNTFVGIYVLSSALALMATLMVEMPMISVGRIILGNLTKPKAVK